MYVTEKLKEMGNLNTEYELKTILHTQNCFPGLKYSTESMSLSSLFIYLLLNHYGYLCVCLIILHTFQRREHSLTTCESPLLLMDDV